MATIRIGISGWRYTPWRGVFYPQDLPQRLELHHASRILPTIEINSSFYSLQYPQSYALWHDDTPAGFVFAVKGPRFITHLKRLNDVQKPLATFFAMLPRDTESALKLARKRDMLLRRDPAPLHPTEQPLHQ